MGCGSRRGDQARALTDARPHRGRPRSAPLRSLLLQPERRRRGYDALEEHEQLHRRQASQHQRHQQLVKAVPLAGPVPAARLREAARRRLSAYVRGHGAELARTLKVEAGFEVPLAAARIRGRVDLLLRADGAGRADARQAAGGLVGAASDGRPVPVELIDFKTSANRPPSEIHVNQLRLYAEALVRLGYEPVRMAVHSDFRTFCPDSRART